MAETPTTDRPTITVLCGSTRFYDAFQQANYDLTMAGHIVLAPGVWVRSSPAFADLQEDQRAAAKVALDLLHLKKIDLADEVLVLNVGGYVGDSTRSEIEYAELLGKPIRYLEPARSRDPQHQARMDAVKTHLEQVHHNLAAAGLSNREAVEQHHHEHHGPGGLRNHDEPADLHDWQWFGGVRGAAPAVNQ